MLMTQAGELVVTNAHIAHRLTELEDIIALWEEWNKKILDSGLPNLDFKSKIQIPKLIQRLNK